MGSLRKESQLYEKLDDMHRNKKERDISLEFYNECIDETKKYSKREIKFVLFKLNCLYTDVDTGMEKTDTIANTSKKIVGYLAGKNYKVAFINNVLNTALQELDTDIIK